MTEKNRSDMGGNAEGVSAGPDKNGSQENIKVCQHRNCGCISQSGYLCMHGSVCEPMDKDGRRFTVSETIEGGQRFVSRVPFGRAPGDVVGS